MIGVIFRIALRELRHNMLRSGLTALGIIIGVAAVIIIVTLGGGATKSVTSDISSLGQNMLILVPGSRGHGPFTEAARFKPADIDAIRREVHGLSSVSPAVTATAVAVFGNENWQTQIVGGTEDYLKIRELDFAVGRPFTESEERAGKAVCILGETVRQKLFGAQNPEGERIRLDKVSCQVIGVFAPKGAATMGQDQDDLVVMPIKTVQRRIAGNDDITFIFIAAEDSSVMGKVKADVGRLMRERRGLQEGMADDFEINDVAEIAAMVERITGVLTAFLSAIAGVSLVVGGIGIMNIMLVSVTERTREIGIRLAIGALEREVLLQFLIEAMLLSATGGILGVIVGIVISIIAAQVLHVPLVLDLPVMLLAVGFSAVVGIAFGYFPARRAARLDPIEALRYE